MTLTESDWMEIISTGEIRLTTTSDKTYYQNSDGTQYYYDHDMDGWEGHYLMDYGPHLPNYGPHPYYF